MRSLTITDLPPIREDDFLTSVIDLAHVYGWRVAHFRKARTEKGWRTAVQADGKGFPDLVLVRIPRVILAELKTNKGQLTAAQGEWIADLYNCPGVEVYIWRPRDWDSIVERLDRRDVATRIEIQEVA